MIRLLGQFAFVSSEPGVSFRSVMFGCMRLLVVPVLLSVGACTPVMRTWTYLEFASPVSAVAVIPLGGGISDAVMIRVKISLGSGVVPFTLVFPDGFRVSSRELTREILIEHGDSLGRPSRINAEWVRRGELKWESSDGVEMYFWGDRTTGEVTSLGYCSPSWLPGTGRGAMSFVAADGTAVGLPISHAGMVRLFGPHVVADRDFILGKISCF